MAMVQVSFSTQIQGPYLQSDLTLSISSGSDLGWLFALVQGLVQGLIQGLIQGMVQGLVQGLIAGSLPEVPSTRVWA